MFEAWGMGFIAFIGNVLSRQRTVMPTTVGALAKRDSDKFDRWLRRAKLPPYDRRRK